MLTYVEHTFYPQGYSLAVILAESHATLHTWPEYRRGLIDYFSCADDPRADEFLDYLDRQGLRVLTAEHVERPLMKDGQRH